MIPRACLISTKRTRPGGFVRISASFNFHLITFSTVSDEVPLDVYVFASVMVNRVSKRAIAVSLSIISLNFAGDFPIIFPRRQLSHNP
jgi:hypothetical protein